LIKEILKATDDNLNDDEEKKSNLDQKFEKYEASKASKALAIERAMTISDQIINQYESSLSAENLNLVKIIAFAYAIKALTQYEAGKLQTAIPTYKHSKELYETYGLQKDGDQYARVVNRLAMMYEENKDVVEAEKAYEALSTYWAEQTAYQASNHLPQNIYQARYYNTYATFLENSGDLSAALTQLTKAYEIRKKSEPDSLFTAKNADRLTKLYDTYAATLETSGDLANVLIQLEKAYAFRKETQPDHPSTVLSAEKIARLKETIQKSETKSVATVSVSAFPGTLYGGSQSPRATCFAGTSVTPLLGSESKPSTEETAQTVKHTI
jgi:hypothetical protein